VSQENLALIRRCVTARDPGSYAAVARLIDPEVVVDLSVRPDGRVYRGRRKAFEALRSWVDRWEDYSYEVERLIDAGDQVVVLFRETGRGKESGVASEIVGATVWTVADGKVVHTKTYTDRREALEAVGLSESRLEE